jgi:2-succinyl-5-enolpyruvyl-6-hydroxy-3-cyclohexene-1-carboxylate synthase
MATDHPTYPNPTFAPIACVVDELCRSGLCHAITSPGSRNAPLALSLAADERVHCLSVIDERSAGFFALGIAKATNTPVAVTCTSGTAAANLLPAIVEAHESNVGLLVLTADRPPELREVGAGQAIDQIKLYGGYVKWFCEVGNHPPTRDSAIHYRSLACRAYQTAQSGPPGVVHLNFGLREPLAPVAHDQDPTLWQGRSDGSPWVQRPPTRSVISDQLASDIRTQLERSSRGVIVCGITENPCAAQVARLAEACGFVIFAEPTSGLRFGDHDRSKVIAHYDALLRATDFFERHRPDTVLRIGSSPTSKLVRQWISDAHQIVLDPSATWHEPTRQAHLMVGGDPAKVIDSVLDAFADQNPSPKTSCRHNKGWQSLWLEADRLARETLAGSDERLEPRTYLELARALPSGSMVWLSSSMPIRDADTFFDSEPTELCFLSNRGANGIDGVVSSALGAAATGRRLFLLTGELALLHDIGGLVTALRHGIELTIICINNGGGGIFDYLPVAAQADWSLYEKHLLTPTEIDLRTLADLFGLGFFRAARAQEVCDRIKEPGLIELRIDRDQSQAERSAIFQKLASATASLAETQQTG